MTQLDFQLGKIEKINADGTINIKDFRSGGMLYQNIPIEHNAINQQQPVEGQHVLFFTTGGTGDVHQTSLAKVVRMYGSTAADKKLVLASPIDLAPGEGKMVSQTGSMIYVANGGLRLSSCGQSITLYDPEQLLELICQNIHIITQDGFGITKDDDGVLNIKKGTVTVNNGEEAITSATVNITIDNKTIRIYGQNASVNIDVNSGKVNINAKEIDLNGTTPVARKNDTVSVTLPAGTNLGTNGGGSLVTSSPINISGTITSGSDTVKAG